MIEVELKARLRDRAATEAKVASFAVHAGDVDKLDAYWHGPDWRRERGTKSFRVRSEGDRTLVTFKYKSLVAAVEVNREREFEVSDPKAFEELALRLGCEPYYTKRKRGLCFTVPATPGSDGPLPPATVEIVEVEGLGDFIEVEVLLGEGEDDSTVAQASERVRAILERSGARAEDIEPRFYSELLLAAGRIPAP